MIRYNNGFAGKRLEEVRQWPENKKSRSYKGCGFDAWPV